MLAAWEVYTDFFSVKSTLFHFYHCLSGEEGDLRATSEDPEADPAS